MANGPRVMLDVNVIVSGIIWPRWQHEILRHALIQDFTLVLAPLIIEASKRHIAAIDDRYSSHLEKFLNNCRYEEVPNPSREDVMANLDLVRDKADIPIALTAIRSKVDYFVTYDKDFTNVDETTKAVRGKIPGIMMPPVFLRDVMGWSSNDLEQIRLRKWDDISELLS